MKPEKKSPIASLSDAEIYYDPSDYGYSIRNSGKTHLLVGDIGTGVLVEPGETTKVSNELLLYGGIRRLAQ